MLQHSARFTYLAGYATTPPAFFNYLLLWCASTYRIYDLGGPYEPSELSPLRLPVVDDGAQATMFSCRRHLAAHNPVQTTTL